MKRNMKLVVAVLLALTILMVASGVWAGTRMGTLGPQVHQVKISGTSDKAVNMGDATFEIGTGDTAFTFGVERTKVPNTYFGAPPAGLVYRSDGFIVTAKAVGLPSVTACFAYSPQDAAKGSAIYVFSNGSWTYLGGVVSGSPTTICATTIINNGGFALLGAE